MARRSRAGMRTVLALLLAAAMAAESMAAEPPGAPAADKPSAPPRPLHCEPTLGRDRLTVVCSITPSEARRVRVRIHFTGSHDDTTASIEVAIGDTPVVCDAGSKTSTEGEDGDVTLDCQFNASGKPGTAAMLRASARWFHAQYVGFAVDEHKL